MLNISNSYSKKKPINNINSSLKFPTLTGSQQEQLHLFHPSLFMCYLLQSQSGTDHSSCVLPGLACRTSPEWCQGWWGRSTCITFMGYTEVTMGRDRTLQELQPSMLPAEGRRGLGSPAGSTEAPTTPAPRQHYICKSAASHQHTSCWKGKWGAHSNHCCFGGTVSKATPHRSSCCCKPNHVHTGPSNSVVTTWISPLTAAW